MKNIRLALSSALLLGGAMGVTPSGARSAGADEPPEPAQIVSVPLPDLPLTPEALADALSCRSEDAQRAFAAALFLEQDMPRWMRVYDGGEARGMIGTYGYRLKHPITFFGRRIDKLFFFGNWIVTVLPRADALAFVQERQMQRAPIKATEQYSGFIDPEIGPMLGVFEPTGDALAKALVAASGAEPPPSPPSRILFAGCNYTRVSRQQFLDAARQADGLVAGAARSIDDMASEAQPGGARDGHDQGGGGHPR